MILTMQEQWLKYRETNSPNGMPPEFEKEIRQAFWVGAYAPMMIWENLAKLKLSREETTARHLVVMKEISDTCADMTFGQVRRQ